MLNLKKYAIKVPKAKLIKTATILTLVFTMSSNVNAVSAETSLDKNYVEIGIEKAIEMTENLVEEANDRVVLSTTVKPNYVSKEEQSLGESFERLEIIIEDIDEYENDVKKGHGSVNLINLVSLINNNMLGKTNISTNDLQEQVKLLIEKYGNRDFNYIIKETEYETTIELISEVNYISIIIEEDLIKVSTSNKPGGNFVSDDNIRYEKLVNNTRIDSEYRSYTDEFNNNYKTGSYEYKNPNASEYTYQAEFSEIELANSGNYMVTKKDTVYKSSSDTNVITTEYIFSSGKTEIKINKLQYEFIVELMQTVDKYDNLEEFVSTNIKIFNYYLQDNKVSGREIAGIVKQNPLYETTKIPTEVVLERVQEYSNMYTDTLFDVNQNINKYQFKGEGEYLNIDLGANMFKISTGLTPHGNFSKSEKLFTAKTTDFMQSDLSAIENSDERGNKYIEGTHNYYTFDPDGTAHLTKTTFKELEITNAKTEYEYTISEIEYIIKGVLVGREYTISSYKDVVTITEEDYNSLLAAFALMPNYTTLSSFVELNLANLEAAMNNHPLGK